MKCEGKAVTNSAYIVYVFSSDLLGDTRLQCIAYRIGCPANSEKNSAILVSIINTVGGELRNVRVPPRNEAMQSSRAESNSSILPKVGMTVSASLSICNIVVSHVNSFNYTDNDNQLKLNSHKYNVYSYITATTS